MTSTSSRQDSTAMGSEPNPTSNTKAQYYSAATTGFPPQAPPYARPTQYQIRSPMPPLTTDQSPGYPYTGQVFRAPANQSGTVAGPLPSTALGKMYQRAPTPPTFSGPPGTLPSFPPPNAGPGLVIPRPPPPTALTGLTATLHNQNPIPGSILTAQTATSVNQMAISGPFVSGQRAATPNQPPISGSFPPTRVNQPGVSGAFSMGQMVSTVDQASIPGSVQATPVNPPPVSGSYRMGQLATLNKIPISGPFLTTQVATPVNQTPMSFPPSQMAAPVNQTAVSESFASPPNAMRAVPQRGPPTFGLPQAATTTATYKSPSLLNLAPVPPGFPGQTGSQGLPHVVPPYMPATVAQAPPFRPVAQQPGLQASQHPQYVGGQPPTAFDGLSNRASPPYQGTAPPFQSMQSLVEEFQSLSVATLPGSMEATIDPNSLPRPLMATEYPVLSSTANSHGRYLRLTSGSLPNSQSMAARWHLPLGAVVHPLAEAPLNEEVPVIDFGTSGIVRCRRCRTYINPYAAFTDNGRRWKCNLCGLNNEVPSEYYCPLDQNGRRKDADERPELSQGSVEFIAPAEYMVRPPMPPVYFFLIDVSSSAIKTGMLQIAVDTIKSCLDKLPGYPRTQIGFLTFDSTLHFYNLKSSLTQPQMMVVADLDDPFLPMPDDLLVNLSESRAVVETLLNSLPSIFKDNSNVESAVGPALRAVFMIMSQLGGKLLLFQSTLPSLGVGRLKIRGDDPRIYGSDREPALRNPEDPFYKQMAADFSKFQISVNLYAFSENYIDLASLGTLVKYTAGQVYFYPSFQPHLSREKFSYELSRDLTRETAWEAVLRIRCGKGMRFTTYHGHFMLRSSDLMALPAVDCDKAFAMQLTLEETLLTSQTAYFQAALLYTSSNGERRIRIHTFAAPLTSDLNEMYRSADTGAIVMITSRLALEKSLTSKLDEVRQQIVQMKLVLALREYQNMYGVQHHLTGRLIYPESLKLLPLYCLSLYKCLALRGGFAGATLDERLSTGFDMMVMSIPRLLNLLYPTMLRLDEYLFKGGTDVKSIQPLPLTAERLDSRGAFLVNDGLRFIVWLGSVLPAEFSVHLLGMEAANSANLSKVAVWEQDNDLSKRFMNLLKSLRLSNPALHQQCLLVRQGDQPREGFLVLLNLVEDRSAGSIGYADWMIQIYRQVKQKT